MRSILRDRRFFRYLLVGGINTTLVYGVYAGAIFFDVAYPVALAMALVFGIVVGFNVQGHFVFSERTGDTFAGYVASWLVLYVINVGIIASLKSLGVNAYWAGALAMPVMAVLSFAVLRSLVFRGREKK